MVLDLSAMPSTQWHIVLIFVFVFGLTWGSFLNVVIHRLPLEESVVTPRSRCPSCKKPIPWYWNIPVLSWVMLRARCANCGVKISFRYPAVELITGILFTASAIYNPEAQAWPFQFWFMAALVASTFIDIDHWILPDKITLPGIVIGFISSFFVSQINWIDSLAGIFVGGGILYGVAWAYRLYAKKDGLGGGDIKFLAMIGAFLGAKGALATLILSSFGGSILGIILMLLKGKKGGTAIQFGPFLAFGALAAFFFGTPLWLWYFGSH